MSKRTEWYPANVNPVHVGVYEVKRYGFDGSRMPIHRGLWTGNGWVYADSFELMGFASYMSMQSENDDKWRGLTRRQK